MFPGWAEFGGTSWLYRRSSQDSREEVTLEDLQGRLDRLEVTGQDLRDMVLLEEQLSQCRQFMAILPNLTPSCAESRFDKYKTGSDRVLETWINIKDRDRQALEKFAMCCLKNLHL